MTNLTLSVIRIPLAYAISAGDNVDSTTFFEHLSKLQINVYKSRIMDCTVHHRDFPEILAKAKKIVAMLDLLA